MFIPSYIVCLPKTFLMIIQKGGLSEPLDPLAKRLVLQVSLYIAHKNFYSQPHS